MKNNYLIKTIPLIITFLIITFLSINNQKQSTRLRILIWNTPSLKLGTYLAISSGTGFILSYLITSNLAKINNLSSKEKLEYRDDNKYEINKEYPNTNRNTNTNYDNTLIERDIKDPSPTINANFRIIGRMQRKPNSDKYYQSDNSIPFEEQSYEMSEKTETSNKLNSITNDWNDESYSIW